MVGSICGIEINGSFEAEFVYMERFRVRIELPCDILQKLELMEKAAKELGSNETGEIIFTEDAKRDLYLINARTACRRSAARL
jgi:hypothetical protein